MQWGEKGAPGGGGGEQKLTWGECRAALTQLGTQPDLLLHIPPPHSPYSPCHGLPPRFWELHVPEHSGL